MHITTLYHHQLLNKLQPVIQPNPSNSVVTQHNATSVIVYAFKQDHMYIFIILNFACLLFLAVTLTSFEIHQVIKCIEQIQIKTLQLNCQ